MVSIDQMTPNDSELAKKKIRYRGVREIAKKMKNRIDRKDRGIDIKTDVIQV